MVAPVLERLRSTVGLKSRKNQPDLAVWKITSCPFQASGRSFPRNLPGTSSALSWLVPLKAAAFRDPAKTVTLEKSIGRSMCVQFILP